MDPKKETGYSHQLVKERNQVSNKVKLCGYLKKKRNKVGGWRKMWFVLQDKLLLSYGSKEEYDNKLVSFKDVLNLVPGTLVRPLGGFRFTIETTSNAMYTFHCDDRTAYREWITVLLDSLATQPSVVSQKFSQRFCNISVDNIPNVIDFNALNLNRNDLMTNSFDSLTMMTTMQPPSAPSSVAAAATAANTTSAVSCVRLPIAYNTAKILERNGVNSCDLQQIQQIYNNNRKANLNYTRNREEQQQQNEYAKSVHHFRLHRDKKMTTPHSSYSDMKIMGSLQQSSSPIYHKQYAPESVLMINRMFNNSLQQKHDSSRCNNVVHKEFHIQNFRSTNHNNDYDDNCDDEATLVNDRLKCGCKERKFVCSLSSNGNMEINSCSMKDCKAMGMVKDKIQRMNIKGTKEFTLEHAASSVDQQNRSKIVTTTSVEEQVLMQKESPNVNSTLEPIYAVVDLKNKYEQRKMRNSNFELKRCNSYDSIIHSTTYSATTASPSKLQRNEKSTSLTEDDIDDIYEDGDKFFTSNINSPPLPPSLPPHTTKSVEENENIYEPINVRNSQSHAFWKYFTRLKVNSLLHLTTRMRKRNSDYDSIKLPPTMPTLPTTASASPKPRKTNASHFSSIKHKFGTHRKSMQVRVRKLCMRASYEPKPFFVHSQKQQAECNDVNGTLVPVTKPKKPKYRWRSVKIRPKKVSNQFDLVDADDGDDDDGDVNYDDDDVGGDDTDDGCGVSTKTSKRFFGSLPHLGKAPRISLFATKHLQLKFPRENDSNNKTNNENDDNVMVNNKDLIFK